MHLELIRPQPDGQPSSRYTVDPLWLELVRRYRRRRVELALTYWADRVRVVVERDRHPRSAA
jgi:hypothetical protein